MNTWVSDEAATVKSVCILFFLTWSPLFVHPTKGLITSKREFMTIYRRHLTQFGPGEDAPDLSKQTNMVLLSWLIRYFVPVVTHNPGECWSSMIKGVYLDKYISSSDLAFAVLVLEHHIMKWRYILQFEWETGKPPTDMYIKRAKQGLLYDDGFTGEEAKKRFDQLNVYFYDNFYTNTEDKAKKQKKVLQLAQLQTRVNKAVANDAKAIEQSIAKYNASRQHKAAFEDEETKQDILHRVFYYLHV